MKMNKNIQTLGLVGLLSGITGGCHNNDMVRVEDDQTSKHSAYLEGNIDSERVAFYRMGENLGATKMSIMPISQAGMSRTYFDNENDGLINLVRICNSERICQDYESFKFPGLYIVDSEDGAVFFFETAQKDYKQKLDQLKRMRKIK